MRRPARAGLDHLGERLAHMSDQYFNERQQDGLVWLPEAGMGHYPVSVADAQVYDQAYWDKYVGYSKTLLGVAITNFRVELVRQYIPAWRGVLDVGIGCGDFLTMLHRLGYKEARGYDVSPVARRWLDQRHWFSFIDSTPVMTFWDVLEHLEHPADALAKARHYVFVSLPIFSGGEHVLRSKHFRKDEHRWYWTESGFRRWTASLGFECLEASLKETVLGREDIVTFVLRRVGVENPYNRDQGVGS